MAFTNFQHADTFVDLAMEEKASWLFDASEEEIIRLREELRDAFNDEVDENGLVSVDACECMMLAVGIETFERFASELDALADNHDADGEMTYVSDDD